MIEFLSYKPQRFVIIFSPWDNIWSYDNFMCDDTVDYM